MRRAASALLLAVTAATGGPALAEPATDPYDSLVQLKLSCNDEVISGPKEQKRMYRPRPHVAYATGFFVREDGLVITTYHNLGKLLEKSKGTVPGTSLVVGCNPKDVVIGAFRPDGIHRAQIDGAKPDYVEQLDHRDVTLKNVDVMVLKFQTEKAPHLCLAPVRGEKYGDELEAIDLARYEGLKITAHGFPSEQAPTYRPLPGHAWSTFATDDPRFLTMSPAVQEGMSGGPVVRSDGAVVGIVYGNHIPKSNPAGTENFFVPLPSFSRHLATKVDPCKSAPVARIVTSSRTRSTVRGIVFKVENGTNTDLSVDKIYHVLGTALQSTAMAGPFTLKPIHIDTAPGETALRVVLGERVNLLNDADYPTVPPQGAATFVAPVAAPATIKGAVFRLYAEVSGAGVAQTTIGSDIFIVRGLFAETVSIVDAAKELRSWRCDGVVSQVHYGYARLLSDYERVVSNLFAPLWQRLLAGECTRPDDTAELAVWLATAHADMALLLDKAGDPSADWSLRFTILNTMLERDLDVAIKPALVVGRGLENSVRNLIRRKMIRSLSRGESLEAVRADYPDAVEVMDAETWGDLCYAGTVLERVGSVRLACEESVRIADMVDEASRIAEPYFARGLNRSALGDLTGAADDFAAYLTYLSKFGTAPFVPEVNGWIAALRSGRNPIDIPTLDRLREMVISPFNKKLPDFASS